MRVDGKLGASVVCLIFVLSAGCANRTAPPEPTPIEWPGTPTLEQIEQAPKLVVRVYDLGTGEWATEPRDYPVTDPETLAAIREWIVEYAWPPIPPQTIGAVRPRGAVTVFENLSDPTSRLRLDIWGSLSRASPKSIQVTDEAWGEFLALLPRNGKDRSRPADIPG